MATRARVGADIDARVDRLAGRGRIGIDEISYKRGHRYLIVVVDHDTGALVWAAPGRDEATRRRFFDALGDERAAQITHVSADAADWIATVVTERCPNAVQCADAFHVVAWATEALDEVRRQAWNEARGAVDRRRVGRASGHARALKRARYALWKNPENLTDRQRDKLAWDRQDRPSPAPRLPAQRGAAHGVRPQGPSRQGGARPLDQLGPSLPDPGLRRAAATDREAPRRHRRGPRLRPVERADRIDQHQDSAHHPSRFRLSQRRASHRPRHAQPRRSPTGSPGPPVTHGCVRRTLFLPR